MVRGMYAGEGGGADREAKLTNVFEKSLVRTLNDVTHPHKQFTSTESRGDSQFARISPFQEAVRYPNEVDPCSGQCRLSTGSQAPYKCPLQLP